MILSSELRMLLAFLVAFFAALFVIPRLASIARAIGLIDRPDHRKVHQVPRPLVGGIGMVIAATFSSLLVIPIRGFRGFFLGLSVLLLIGFLDDFRELGPRRKFLAQILASVLFMYLGDVYLVSFGDLLGFGPIILPDIDIVVWAVTIFCVVGVINSLNLVDGLDGLAGSIAFVAFSAFALHAAFGGNSILMLLNLAFAGAVLGFLRFNWPPSTVFMGDAGSLCLGFALAYMSIVMTQGENPLTSPVTPLLILAVPITDTIVVMTRRALKGHSPFKADQYHLHHILMRYGMSKELTVRVIVGFCLLLSGVTLFEPFYDIADYIFFGIYILYLLGYIVATLYLMREGVTYKEHETSKKKSERAALVMRSVLHTLDYLKIFRKDIRYPLELEMSCMVIQSNETYSGTVIDISRRGCRAIIPELTSLGSQQIINLSFPFGDEIYSLAVPADHIWAEKIDNSYQHGFQFKNFEVSRHEVFLEFMVRGRKNS